MPKHAASRKVLRELLPSGNRPSPSTEGRTLTRESRRAGRLGLPVAEKEKEGWVGEIREIVFDVFAVVCYRIRVLYECGTGR